MSRRADHPDRPHLRRRTALAIGIAALAGLSVGCGERQSTPAPLLPAQGCSVTVDGFTTALTWEQAENVSIIVGESIRRELPPRAATIALVTAYQESDLRNLDHGDRDSVGLFQQRPSQGWGTVEEIMDPWYSAGKFYEALVTIPDWQNGIINDVAQAVQRSGYPQAYAQHEPKGRAWASALTGHSPAAVTCVDRAGKPANPGYLTEFIQRVWSGGVSVDTSGTVLTMQGADGPTNWAVAQLGLLRGQPAGLVAAQCGALQWLHSNDQYAVWQAADPAIGGTILTLRG